MPSKPEFDGEWVRLGDVCEIINGYAFKSREYVSDGIRIIRIANVQRGYLEDSMPCYYPASAEVAIRPYLLNEGDLLLSLTGNVGRVAYLPKEMLPAALNQRVACLRIKPGIQLDSEYLFHILNSDKFENDCTRSAKGLAQKNMSTKWLKDYLIPRPPICVQKQIASRFNSIRKMVEGTSNQLERLDDLVKSRFVDLGDEGQVLFLIANRWDEDRQPFHILLVNTCLANSSLGICFKIAFREFGSHLGAQECRNHESLIRMKTHHIRLENRHFWNMRNKHCFTHASNTVDSVNNNVILVDAVTSALAFVAIEPFQRTVVRTFVPE